MERLVEILRKAVSDGASDIFIVAGGALSYKVDGEIRPMEASAERLMPDDTKVLLDEIYECASREKTHFLEEGDDDFSFEKWCNHFYYIGTCVLRMSENKFYKSSPRELKTLEKLSNNYLKNTLLDTYTTIIKAQNSSEGYEENREEKKIYVGRARDLFK